MPKKALHSTAGLSYCQQVKEYTFKFAPKSIIHELSITYTGGFFFPKTFLFIFLIF